MYLKLRILFTILSVLCAVALFPIGTFFGLTAAIICFLVGALFAALMVLCKQKQEQQEANHKKTDVDNQTDPSADEKTN